MISSSAKALSMIRWLPLQETGGIFKAFTVCSASSIILERLQTLYRKTHHTTFQDPLKLAGHPNNLRISNRRGEEDEEQYENLLLWPEDLSQLPCMPYTLSTLLEQVPFINAAIPYCPITHKLARDPISDPSTQHKISYEKKNLLKWSRYTSPTTRERINVPLIAARSEEKDGVTLLLRLTNRSVLLQAAANNNHLTRDMLIELEVAYRVGLQEIITCATRQEIAEAL